MQTRTLGDSDLQLTTIGLGTWAIGGGDWKMGWGPQDEADSVASILEALECGINWIDTAAGYGFGKSEEAVGKAIKAWSGGEVIVATKCGILPLEDGRTPNRHISRATIEKEVEDSLRRLQLDTIDLYQIHWPVPDENVEEAWGTLQDLKAAGKIRYAGVSNFSVEQLQRAQTIGHVTSAQPFYNLLERDIEADVIPWCRESGTGLVTYSPMHCGLLTGKVDANWLASLGEGDWRANVDDPRVRFAKEPLVGPFVEFVDQLKAIAADSGHSIAQLAVAWVIAQAGVTSAIVGARKRGQIAETVAAGEWELGEAELGAVGGAYDEFSANALPESEGIV